MGTSMGGLTFKEQPWSDDPAEFISTVFGRRATSIEEHLATRANGFDHRNDDCVLLFKAQNAWVILNADLAFSAFHDDPKEILRMHPRLPDRFTAFAYYDSGGTFGYALYQSEIRTRMLVLLDDTLHEEGAIQEWEVPYLTAPQKESDDGVMVRCIQRGNRVREMDDQDICMALTSITLKHEVGCNLVGDDIDWEECLCFKLADALQSA